MVDNEEEIGVEQARKVLGRLVDNAAVRGVTTFLTRHGRRHAAIVPVDAAKNAFDEEWEHWSTRTALNVLNAIDEYHLAELARVREKLAGFGLTEDQINETLATVKYSSIEGAVAGSVEGAVGGTLHGVEYGSARNATFATDGLTNPRDAVRESVHDWCAHRTGEPAEDTVARQVRGPEGGIRAAADAQEYDRARERTERYPEV